MGASTPTAARAAQRRRIICRAALAAAIVYFVAGGVLALWFPADGLDLYVSYVAGTCSVGHASPYDHAAYVSAWESLSTPGSLADTREFAFAYPPAWIPVCIGLNMLPWGAALVLWKLLNVIFLVGIVHLTFRLLRARAFDIGDRYAVWCFALTLSPTISVMTVGQTSLLVVFMVLMAGWTLHQGRWLLSGLALTLGMIKPQVAAPFVVFLLFRRELRVLSVAGVCSLLLTGLGLSLSHSDLGTVLGGVRAYVAINGPTSHIAVGIASLLAHLTDLGVGAVSMIGVIIGVGLIAGLAFHRRTHDVRDEIPDVLPVLLYLAPLCFRCHGYDLVALIPLFAWSRVEGSPKLLRAAIQGLCLVLIVPRAALHFVYLRFGSRLLSPDAYRVAEFSFRSWILILLLPLVLLTLRAKLRNEPARPTSLSTTREKRACAG